VRILGVDFGQRRLGVALSDPTALLASPWRSVPAGSTPIRSADAIASAIDELRAAGEEVAAVVVGLPRRLNGEDTDQTTPARDFARALHQRTALPVHLQDERLSSREAESRLAVRERDWRKRKLKLDAAAAAVILQDFLDAHAHERAAVEG
jgi:putative holliday junction resolvase